MKITEIEIDDSQTGYCWIQIYTSNKKQAISLRRQILEDQAVRERLQNEIAQSQNIIAHSSNKMQIATQDFLIYKLLLILKGEDALQTKT